MKASLLTTRLSIHLWTHLFKKKSLQIQIKGGVYMYFHFVWNETPLKSITGAIYTSHFFFSYFYEIHNTFQCDIYILHYNITKNCILCTIWSNFISKCFLFCPYVSYCNNRIRKNVASCNKIHINVRPFLVSVVYLYTGNS